MSGSLAHAQDELPCGDYFLTTADVPNLSVAWVAQCSHCLSVPNPTSTPLPSFSTATLTRTPTSTVTVTLTPTQTDTPLATFTPTQESFQTLAGFQMSPLGDTGYYVVDVAPPNALQIAPGYSAHVAVNPDWYTTANDVQWDVVGVYYWVQPDVVSADSSFSGYIYEDGMIADENGDGSPISGLGNFGCFDAEIFEGSFDAPCDVLQDQYRDLGEQLAVANDTAFKAELGMACVYNQGCLEHLGEYQSLAQICDDFPEWSEGVSAYCDSPRHSGFDMIPFDDDALHQFSVGWVDGHLIPANGEEDVRLSTPITVRLILAPPTTAYEPTLMPTQPPEPPSCPSPLFNSATNYMSDGGPSPYDLDYWENPGEIRYPAGETVFDGQNLTSYPYNATISGVLEYFVGITAMFDLRGQREITGIRYEAVLPSQQPYKSFFVRLAYYSESVGQWTIGLPAYLAPYQTYSINDQHDDITHVWMRIEFRYNSSDEVKASNSTITLPLESIQVRNETSGEWIDFSRSACDIEGTSSVPTGTPTLSPTPTATGGIPTFTRTPTRTPLSPSLTPSSTVSTLDNYCLNPLWRNSPTPSQVATSTSTLNPTASLAAATQTPGYVETLQHEFTLTAAPPTYQAQTATAGPTGTFQIQSTQTISAAGTSTAVFPETATWIASTPGNDLEATSQALSTVISLDGSASGQGESGHVIDIGGGGGGSGNSTIDLDDTGDTLLFRFRWDPQPRPGKCYVLMPDESFSFAGQSIQLFELEVCVNWVDIPDIHLVGIRFPVLELLLFPFAVVIIRRVWSLL